MPRLPFPEPLGPPQGPDAKTSSDLSRSAPEGDHPLSVSQVGELIKLVLSEHVPAKLRVVGEVSNLSDRGSGGHWFFSMKDAGATLRCVMFASNARRVKFPVKNGMAVVAAGRLDFFPGQGHVQLYVDRLEPVGVGALEMALRAMMEELRGLGYFDPDRKRALPTMPRKVAVVTSRNAAALQDVIDTASRRWRGCRLYLYDVRVQGADAAPQIAAAIERLSLDGPRLGIDAIILTRGGGSLEDLWAFNERLVADALVHCSIPIVAAIGHETDTTVAELVADVRCATPTQAAMTLIPDERALRHQLHQLASRLSLLARRDVRQRRDQLDALARHPLFRTPRKALGPRRETLDRHRVALVAALRRSVTQRRAELDSLARQPVFRSPGLLISAAAKRLDQLDHELRFAARRHIRQRGEALAALSRQLESISPARVLERGYSYTLGPDGRVLRHAAEATPGDRLTTRLADGAVRSIVEGGLPASMLDSMNRTRLQSNPPRRKRTPPDDLPRLF